VSTWFAPSCFTNIGERATWHCWTRDRARQIEWPRASTAFVVDDDPICARRQSRGLLTLNSRRPHHDLSESRGLDSPSVPVCNIGRNSRTVIRLATLQTSGRPPSTSESSHEVGAALIVVACALAPRSSPTGPTTGQGVVGIILASNRASHSSRTSPAASRRSSKVTGSPHRRHVRMPATCPRFVQPRQLNWHSRFSKRPRRWSQKIVGLEMHDRRHNGSNSQACHRRRSPAKSG